MAKQKRSKSVYVAHRKNQREKILEVAKQIFIERGIEPVTIADIATSSRLTRATIYKYFANRKEIAFEIFKIIISGWHERDKSEVWSHPGTGYQRLERSLNSFCDDLLQFPEETRFVAEFNRLFAKEVLHVLRQSLGEDSDLVIQCLRQGVADGSLQAELNPNLVMAVIYNLNASLLGRLGQMVKSEEEEYGVTADKVMREIYRIFINGIKANSGKNKLKAGPAGSSSRNTRTVKSKK
ncbi:MAG: TetR/AcrR family transcriptional regulator [Acidobacteria bacterium]|nr:TetR/AcrR family transcriptional regulator [Acidobacteriota bacterium]